MFRLDTIVQKGTMYPFFDENVENGSWLCSSHVLDMTDVLIWHGVGTGVLYCHRAPCAHGVPFPAVISSNMNFHHFSPSPSHILTLIRTAKSSEKVVLSSTVFNLHKLSCGV